MGYYVNCEAYEELGYTYYDYMAELAYIDKVNKALEKAEGDNLYKIEYAEEMIRKIGQGKTTEEDTEKES